MEIKQVAQLIAQTLNDKQAEDIVVLDVEGIVNYASYFIIASGRTERHVCALANHIERSMKAYMGRPLSSEGTENGLWVLLDYGDILVHLFRREERDFYDLEGLWQDAPKVEVDFEHPAPIPAASSED